MTAVMDRPRARSARAGGDGYRGFYPALNTRSELMLAAYLDAAPAPADTAPWIRASRALRLAARIVEVHGMPARHAAARQLLAGHVSVYDRFFRLPADWQLSPPAPDAPLTWRNEAGEVVVDIVRAAPASHPLADAATFARLTELTNWAQRAGIAVAGIRVLAMQAPATSLLHDPHTGFGQLAGTAFAPALTAGAGVAR